MKIRGFLVKHRVTTVVRCIFRRHRLSTAYHRVDPPPCWRERCICSVISWTHRLKTKAKAICNLGQSRSSGRSYVDVGREVVEEKPVAVPKGHLAVYVGQKGGYFKRLFVPVVDFNHPLFGELLREAENEFGFSQPGGITIPCRISEFERVQTRIKQGRGARKMPITWK